MNARALTLSVVALALAIPAWANVEFSGNSVSGQGLFSFNPGIGHTATIAAGNGGSGALISNVLDDGICGGNCAITGGYMTLTTGGEVSRTFFPGGVVYTFNPGGAITIRGEIPALGINTLSTLFSATWIGETLTVTKAGSSAIGTLSGTINLSTIYLNPHLGNYEYQGANALETAFALNVGCATGGNCTGKLNTSDVLLSVPDSSALLNLDVACSFGMVALVALRRRIRHA